VIMPRPKIESTRYEEEDDLDHERERVLESCGMMTEEQVALIYACTQKAMRNRSHDEMPPFFKAGTKRLFFRDEVISFFKSRLNNR